VLAFEPGALAGERDVGARESSAEEVDSREILPSDGSYISVSFSQGPVAPEHPLTEVIDLDLEHRLAAACLLEPELKEPDAGEERAGRAQLRVQRRVRGAKR
jgi:hypothetical protein